MMGADINFEDCDLYVEYEYSPRQKGGRNEYGVPVEPDGEGEFIISSVWLGGYDITDLMGAGQMEKLKAKLGTEIRG